MADDYVIATERIYSAEEGRPRYVVAYEGQRVKRSVLEALGYAAPAAVEAKRRPRKTVEDKAVKSPAKKGEEEA